MNTEVKRTRVTDRAGIRKILDEVQKRCRRRIFGEPDDIVNQLEGIEDRLGNILPKCHWQGLRFDLHADCGPIPSSYRGVPETTYVRLERGSHDWFVTHCARTPMRTSRIFPVNLDERTSEIMATLNKPIHWSA